MCVAHRVLRSSNFRVACATPFERVPGGPEVAVLPLARSFTLMSLRRVALALAFFAATPALATNYSLWIHGRGGGGTIGNYSDFGGFGPNTVSAGVNKKAVNWDGVSRISTQNYHVRDALDC